MKCAAYALLEYVYAVQSALVNYIAIPYNIQGIALLAFGYIVWLSCCHITPNHHMALEPYQ